MYSKKKDKLIFSIAAKPTKRKYVQCPGVLGGCGGKGTALEEDVLCPKCLRLGGE